MPAAKVSTAMMMARASSSRAVSGDPPPPPSSHSQPSQSQSSHSDARGSGGASVGSGSGPRVYETVSEVSVDESRSVTSKPRIKLPVGTYVQVVEVVSMDDECRLRGRLDSGGWISLLNTSTQRTWVRRVPTGTYVVTAPSIIVSGGLGMGTKQIDFYGVDEYVEVVAVHYLRRERRVRAKLSTGGYVSLVDTERSFLSAEPLQLGTYVTVTKSPVFSLPEACRPSRILDMGSYVNVVETRFSTSERCLRGRLAEGGWLTLEDKKDGRLRAVPVPLGTYCTHEHQLFVHRRPSMDLTAKRRSSNDRGGGQHGGHRRPSMEHGTHRRPSMEHGGAGQRRNSGGHGPQGQSRRPSGGHAHSHTASSAAGAGPLLQGETYVDVVETRHVPSKREVRGRLAQGGWISLLDTISGYQFARPVPRGVYFTYKETLAVNAGVPCGSKLDKLLKPYTPIEIAETRYVSSERQVRGRLSGGTGGWVSLIELSQSQTQSGAKGGTGTATATTSKIQLAKPMRVGDYLTLVDALVVRENVRLDSNTLRQLKRGKIVDIVETKYVRTPGYRIRGRLASGGWISLVNTKDRKNYAKSMERRGSSS